MQKIRIEEIVHRAGAASVKQSLTGPLDASEVPLNYDDLAPGESFAYGFHAHEGQEELIIQEGKVTFEPETGEVVGEAGDVLRVALGEYQQGNR